MAGQGLVYACGHLTVDLGRRELLVRGIPVNLGDRALEILAVLLDSAGSLVTKDEIMRRVWPGALVEDNTLEVHVSALRRALGDDRSLLKTSYARGYRLLGAWSMLHGQANLPSQATQERRPRHNLPIAGSTLIGRAAEVEELCRILARHRMVTLTGVGGIGKTRLALEAAPRVAEAMPDGAWFIQLATLADPALVASAVARALGLTGHDSSPEAVARAIGDQRLLLILDNCEHVVDMAAAMADAILRLCPCASVLATSRELLRVDGEQTFRVPPLDLPPEQTEDPTRLLASGAATLFLTQARSQDAGFTPSGEEVLAIAEICRRLDGIPLAIEFAAARAATIGTCQVAAGLNDRFELLTIGRRTALPKHRTLRLAIDWSYDLLPDQEAATLCDLSVLAGEFTLDAAMAVVGGLGGHKVLDCITSLVSKSLVSANLRGSVASYHLLETIRLFAAETSRANGRSQAASLRHAAYYRQLAAQAAVEAATLGDAEWLAAHARHLDNWRAALDWAFSEHGDARLGVALTVDIVPVWFKLSQMQECRRRVEQALAIADAEADAHAIMRLGAARAATLFYTEKGVVPEVAAAWTMVLDIAERLGDVEHRLWARWGLWNYQLNHGTCRDAVASARLFLGLATQEADIATGERMVGVSLHYLGEQAEARQHLERSLARHVGTPMRSTIRMQYDHRLAARSFLPRVLWLQGLPDQAMATARAVIADAEAAGHTLALSLALVQAGCPVALLTGEVASATTFVAMLEEKARRHGLGFWLAESRCYDAILHVMRGDVADGLRRFEAATRQLFDFNAAMNITGYMAAMAAALADMPDVAEGPALVREALVRAQRDEEHWCMPELLRLQAAFLLREGSEDAAEALFARSLDLAERQGLQGWSLRAATSLAGLMMRQRRPAQARAVLAPIHARFREGFGTADLLRAQAVLGA